jgi:hypothetical protein
LIDIDRDAGAFADGAYMHVPEIDVPSLLVGIVGAASSERGHPASSR